jgi:small-conductance mechanosensitive channel
MGKLKEIWGYELFELFHQPITVKNFFFLAFLIVATLFFLKLYKAFVHKTLKPTKWFDEERAKMVYGIGRILIIILAIFLVFYAMNLKTAWNGFLNYEIVHEHDETEGFSMRVYNIFLFILALVIGRMLMRLATSMTKNGLRANPRIDTAQEFTITKLVGYAGGIITFLIAVQAAGFNLTAILFGSAALLVALGLGIQHIFDDIISGLILLFDDTFQVGDVIEVDGMVAQVKHIDIRTSRVLTKDGVTIVVPNRKLTSSNIDNMSHGSPLSRFNIDVGVAYGSDVAQVKELLYNCAKEHADVSKSKAIIVQFTDFGDSSLKFRLLFWTQRIWDVEVLQSELRFGIHEAFVRHNIKIPYPQREIHVNDRSQDLTY